MESTFTTTFAVFAFLWGAVWGSFLNVVIWRLPRGESLSRPGSRCPSCGHPVRWYDNVPVLSWLLLRGKCRDCATPIRARYPLVEALMGVLALLLWLQITHHHFEPESLPQVLGIFMLRFYFFAALVAIAFIDLDLTVIPDMLSKPLVVWGLLAGLLFPRSDYWAFYMPSIDLVDSAIGGLLGFGLLFVVFNGYRILRGIDGGGGGDLWVLAAIGTNLGWLAIPFVLFAASMQGILAALIATRLPRRQRAGDTGGFLLQGVYREEYWESHPILGSGEDPPGEAPPVDAPGDGSAEAAPESSGPEIDDTSFHVQAVPFGPFLALAAIEYVFVGPAVIRWASSGILP